jgi:hypothetical protein
VSVAGDDESDVSGTLVWFKDARATRVRFPAGWPDGITIKVAGSRYFPSETLVGAFAAPLGTNAATPTEVGTTLSFSGGELLSDVLIPATVRGDVLRVGATDLKGLKLAITKKTGVLTGAFRHPSRGKLTPFKAIYLQRQGIAAGFFIGGNQVGEVLLTRD